MTEGNGRPQTRYALSGDFSIAYQVIGEGPRAMMLIPGFPSHLEHAWEHPKLSYFYRRLASMGQVVLMDKRGTGLSDRTNPTDSAGIEQRKDDVIAVLDAAGIERAAFIGVSDGGPLALFCGAAYPRRTSHVVAVNTYAKRITTPDYPAGFTEEGWEAVMDQIKHRWGEPIFADLIAPGSSDDHQFLEWWSQFMRLSMSPGAALAQFRVNAQTDIRAVLPAIHVPTLVIHRKGDRVNPIDGARYIASQVEGSILVELEGDDHLPWLGDADAVVDAIEAFLTGTSEHSVPSSSLATVLFLDIVGSTVAAGNMGDATWNALLQTFQDIVRSQSKKYGGRHIKSTGDGALSAFEGPATAVYCALAIRSRVRPLDLEVRCGVHTSEVQHVDGDLVGIGVHVASRLMDLASPGEVVVSAVVRDLAFGSDLTFEDRGEHELKGVTGLWRAFSAESSRDLNRD